MAGHPRDAKNQHLCCSDRTWPSFDDKTISKLAGFWRLNTLAPSRHMACITSNNHRRRLVSNFAAGLIARTHLHLGRAAHLWLKLSKSTISKSSRSTACCGTRCSRRRRMPLSFSRSIGWRRTGGISAHDQKLQGADLVRRRRAAGDSAAVRAQRKVPAQHGRVLPIRSTTGAPGMARSARTRPPR